MLIDPMTAVEAARRSLSRPPLRDTHRAGGNAGAPLLVKRLDIPATYYYLVPWQDKSGISLVIQVDAQSGEMTSAAVLPTPVERLVLTAEEAGRVLSDRLGQRIIGEPQLVWQPCHQSASPLQPFYYVQVESGDAFVGSDGSVYRNLTPFGKGG